MRSVPITQEASAELGTGLRLERRRKAESQGRKVKIVPDRRLYRRVPVLLFGRFMREDKQEFPCQVIDMSAGGMAMLSPVPCEENERIVAYLDNFGRLEGIVVRSFEGGFAVRILASPFRREKIANLLTWIVNQKSLGLMEERGHDRSVPRREESKLILPDGEAVDCRVIDVSLSGASIAMTHRPPIGTLVVLGRMRGRVIRHHDQGISIQFADLQDPDSIARSFG
jgi:PilZ domain